MSEQAQPEHARPERSSSDRLFHLVAAGDWERAAVTGRYAPASLGNEGFVHLSYADQVAGVADALYRDLTDAVVVELDPDALGAPVRVEDSYGSGTAFPHLYGAVPTAAAVSVTPLQRDADGNAIFPPARS